MPGAQRLVRTDMPSSDLDAFWPFVLAHAGQSRAQFLQDLFVRWVLDDARDGYFVEFGAADGVYLSNSHFLETERGWFGILAEPARCWHDRLTAGRRCAIDTRCVWTTSGDTLRFTEATAPELSTVASMSASGPHAASRDAGTTYDVQTVSLEDLLDDHRAPEVVDYLSLDTEGSELAILRALDWSRRTIRVITVEHNYGRDRDEIRTLLERHGYERTLTEFSRVDDWYVHASVSRAG